LLKTSILKIIRPTKKGYNKHSMSIKKVTLLSFEPRTCNVLIQCPKQYATVGCDKLPEKFDTYACKEHDNTIIALK